MINYKSVELYGGAIKVELPERFADVSQIRQVPDNQEVFLDQDSFTSIVFDILERVDVGEANSDADALKYHFSDVVEDDTENTHIWTSNTAIFSKLPPSTPAYTLYATHDSSPERIAQAKAPDFTAILLTLLRLPEQKTDIVISINVPHPPGEYERSEVEPAAGRNGNLIEVATQQRDRILQTFEVRDWDLFVQE